MKLKNKVVLVTGGSRGIGKAIAYLFAKKGANVVFTYLNSKKEAKELEMELKDKNLNVLAIKTDVSQINDIKRLLKIVKNKYKRVDILVNNAGIYHRNDFLDSTEKIWDETISTNLKGAFFLSKEVSKIMLEQKGGCIINISSNAGIKPKKNRGIEYGVSKAAMIYLTKSLALTLAPYISVNCIAPGYTETDMASFKNDNMLKEEVKNGIPNGRINKPEDIAKTALFLASEDTKNITGQVIIIDGGNILKHLE